MILPDHHDIPADLYDRRRGEFTCRLDGEYHDRCKICGAAVGASGDAFGGVAYCTETGESLFEW